MIGWEQIAKILAVLAFKYFLWSHALTAVIIMSISPDLACSFMDGSKDDLIQSMNICLIFICSTELLKHP